ncbi:MAG: hypothetical protein ACQEQD_06735 [Bacillota bacterium]
MSNENKSENEVKKTSINIPKNLHLNAKKQQLQSTGKINFNNLIIHLFEDYLMDNIKIPKHDLSTENTRKVTIYIEKEFSDKVEKRMEEKDNIKSLSELSRKLIYSYIYTN